MSAPTQTPADQFYFGQIERRLFGALHEAETFAQRECGIVICYPFGQEYVRSHRACRHLALRFAQAGFPVLRFDYGGTGDSAGYGEDATLRDWRDDIGQAVTTLRDRAGVDSVCVAGLRLGASLAFDEVTSHPDVSALILWEPIVSGDTYMASLAEIHREQLWRFFDGAAQLAASSSVEFNGFPVNSELRGELERLDLLASPPDWNGRTLIVESHSRADIARLRDRLLASGRSVDYQYVPSFTVWREDVDKGLVPDEVIRDIVSWASEVLP